MANSRKILVVDDDYQLVEFIKAILKNEVLPCDLRL
ncbi:MAG: hypothetical protein KatS3mg130_2012 [Candidatus Sumerlaea sp.]|nr:MAG: hypothetical protein KatS3mg130_2012 [Candidatus Sumerlaea sp.]